MCLKRYDGKDKGFLLRSPRTSRPSFLSSWGHGEMQIQGMNRLTRSLCVEAHSKVISFTPLHPLTWRHIGISSVLSGTKEQRCLLRTEALCERDCRCNTFVTTLIQGASSSTTIPMTGVLRATYSSPEADQGTATTTAMSKNVMRILCASISDTSDLIARKHFRH